DRIVVLAATELTTPNEKHAVRQSSNSYVFLSICPRKIYSVAYDFSSNLAGEIPILTASYMCKTADRTHTFRSGDCKQLLGIVYVVVPPRHGRLACTADGAGMYLCLSAGSRKHLNVGLIFSQPQ